MCSGCFTLFATHQTPNLNRFARVRAGCFTLFATHLGRLSELGVLYPNVRVKHFDVDTSSGKLHCTWRLKDDSADDVHYGLLLAASVGIPGEASIFRSLGCLRFRV